MSLSIGSDLILTREEYDRVADTAEEAIRLYSEALQRDDVVQMFAIIRQFSEFFSLIGVPRYNERFLPKWGAPATRKQFEKVNLVGDDLTELLSKINTLNEAALEVDNISESRRADVEHLRNFVGNEVANFQLELTTDDVLLFSDDFSDDSKIASRSGIQVDADRQLAILSKSFSASVRGAIDTTKWNLVVPDEVLLSEMTYGKKYGVEALDVHLDDSVRHYRNIPTEFLYDSPNTATFTSDAGPTNFFDTALEYEIVLMDDVATQNEFIRDQLPLDEGHSEIIFEYLQAPKFLLNQPAVEATLDLKLKRPTTMNTINVKTRYINREVGAGAITHIHVIDSLGNTKTLIPMSPTQRIFHLPSSTDVVRVTIFFFQDKAYRIAHDVRVFEAQYTDNFDQVKKTYSIRDIDMKDVGPLPIDDEFGGERQL